MSESKLIKERIDSIASILDKNKVSFNRSCVNLTSVAYDKEEYGLYAFKLVDDLEKMVNFGVNNGFRSVKDDIKKISEDIVDLSKVNKAMKFNKIVDEHDKLMNKQIKIFEEAGTFKAPINAMIQNTIKGIETIRKEDSYKEKQEILDDIVNSLNEISNRLVNVTDNYSAIAYGYAKKILEGIDGLRVKIARGYLTPLDTKKVLGNIKDNLLLWENQKSSNLKKAKVEESFKFDPNKEDRFYVASNSSVFFEGFDTLKKDTERFSDTLIPNEKIDEVSSKLQNENSKLDQITAQATELKAQMDEGRITAEVAAVKAKQMQTQMKIVQNQIYRYNEQLNKLGGNRYILKQKIYDVMNEVCFMVDENRDNKEYISLFSKNFDFEAAYALLAGSPSSEDIEKFKESYKYAKLYASEQNRALKEKLDQIEEMRNIFEDEEEETIEFETKKVKETTKEELNDIFKSLGVTDQKKTEEKKQEEKDKVDIDSFLK